MKDSFNLREEIFEYAPNIEHKNKVEVTPVQFSQRLRFLERLRFLFALEMGIEFPSLKALSSISLGQQFLIKQPNTRITLENKIASYEISCQLSQDSRPGCISVVF